MEFFSKSKYGVIHPLNLVLMKNSNCGCKILEQILQQIQFSEQDNNLVLLTAKFNRLIKKFYLNENHSSERLRNHNCSLDHPGFSHHWPRCAWHRKRQDPIM